MGRRSQHTTEELRELILSAAEKIVEAGGIAEMSAREIAREIGYAPGTLYNMFENLDDILLHVEARLLAELDQRLADAVGSESGPDAVKRYAKAYVGFALRRPRLWNLLLEHHVPSAESLPAWYQDKAIAPVSRLETMMCGSNGSSTSDERRKARALWSAIHGIAVLATSQKSVQVSVDAAAALVDGIVDAMISDQPIITSASEKPKRVAAKPTARDRLIATR